MEQQLESRGHRGRSRVGGESQSEENYILIYCRSNYKWYLKYKLPRYYPCALLQWSSKHKFELQILSSHGGFTFLSFRYDFQVGVYQSGMEQERRLCQSLAAVIDGSVVHCTPLSKYCPPPPMSHFQVKFTGQVIDLFFVKNAIGAIVLNGNRYAVELFHYDWDDAIISPQKCFIRLDSSVEYPRLSYLLREPTRVDTLIFVSGSNKDTAVFQMSASEEFCHMSVEVLESGLGLSWTSSLDDELESPHRVAFFGFGGKVHSFPDSGLQLELPVECHHIAKIVDFRDKDENLHFACLTEGSHLYVDRELIADSCTSFVVADGFFLFTVMTQGMFDMLFLFSIKDLIKARAAVTFLHLRLPDKSRLRPEKIIQ